MSAVFHQTLAIAWGKVCFSFNADGELVEISLRSRRSVGFVGTRPAGAPNSAALQKWVSAVEQGKAGAFPGPWRLPGDTEFRRNIYRAVAAIPAGKYLSYGEVAAQAGSPRAARAVGSAMAQNPLPLLIPCHRVWASNGLGGFTGGLKLKRAILAAEGHSLGD
jgi:methylated-DNA-[protein]-cysteine S-methyltransferase